MREKDDHIEVLSYNNLTELLLNVIRRRSAMFLGENKIVNLSIFLTGYRLSPNGGCDKYFGSNGFNEWFEKKHYPLNKSFWHITFLDEANEDETKGLEIYFKYLEEYNKDIDWHHR